MYVTIGLDDGTEFFQAIQSRFTTYGFECNPRTIEALAGKCKNISNCEVVDLDSLTEPLPALPNHGYLIPACVGKENGKTDLYIGSSNAASSTVALGGMNRGNTSITMPAVRLDGILATDVWMMQIDIEGM